MGNQRRWVVAAAIVLLAPACSSDSDDADSPFFGDEGAEVSESDGGDSGAGGDSAEGGDGGDGGGGGDAGGDGTSDPSAGAGETEGGIPYPAGGLDVLADAGISIGGQRQLHYPTDRFDELVAFYDDWVEGIDGQTSRADVDGTMVWQVFTDDGLSVITIEPDFETTLGGEDIVVTFVFLVDG